MSRLFVLGIDYTSDEVVGTLLTYFGLSLRWLTTPTVGSC